MTLFSLAHPPYFQSSNKHNGTDRQRLRGFLLRDGWVILIFQK